MVSADDSAMMHYRVELSGVDAPLDTTLRLRMPLPRRRPKPRKEPATVRIFDRSGNQVAAYVHDNLAEANALHDAIVDDLIRLRAGAFRAKYELPET